MRIRLLLFLVAHPTETARTESIEVPPTAPTAAATAPHDGAAAAAEAATSHGGGFGGFPGGYLGLGDGMEKRAEGGGGPIWSEATDAEGLKLGEQVVQEFFSCHWQYGQWIALPLLATSVGLPLTNPVLVMVYLICLKITVLSNNWCPVMTEIGRPPVEA